ncbi:meiotic recombination [Didymella keratinophila]|nr:meiotic recombination [Didymella keratinophila]
MAPAYKVEELLALRDSVSESAVSLDKFADEDVIKASMPPRIAGVIFLARKLFVSITRPLVTRLPSALTYIITDIRQEHVLRPTASAQLIGRRSDRSLRTFVPRTAAPEAPREITPEVVPAAAPPAANTRPSPSPSVKRGKAEALLKEHGSPPGLRVTAGGRIVPGDLPPLGARPGFNIYNPHALRAAPGNIMAAQSQPAPNGTARIELIGGQPVVVVGDRLFALPTVNNGSAVPTAAPATDETLAKKVNDSISLSNQGAMPGLSFAPPRTNSQTPFAGFDLSTLKAQQAVKKQELRNVEQTEVLQSGHQTEGWRASMIEKKRTLIVELDALRKQISALETDPATASQDAPPNPLGAVPTPAPMASFMPSYQQPLAQSMYGFTAANPYAPMVMYPPTFGAFSSFPSVEPAPFVQPVVNPPPHSPGSGNRRSRAIEIKAPQEDSKKPALDPKSPTYEPKGSTAIGSGPAGPPTPSPNKHSSWRQQEPSQSDAQPHRTLSHKPSFSSVDTTDFFPTNTHEHSSTRIAPTSSAQQPARDENKIVPATPEKSWPASPWNEGNTSRARNEESASKLGSWPNAFGKPRSLSPLKHEAESSAPSQSRALQTSSSLRSTGSKTMLPQSQHQQRTAIEEMWPFNMPKAVAHIPSTYQEGYQAGYDHIGMPDDLDVLQGYVQGLLTFIADTLNNRRSSTSAGGSLIQTVDSRTPSLHGLVASSTPHDSAVSMTFNRNEAPVGSQENVRTNQGNETMTSRRDSAYSPHGTIRNAPASLAAGIEFTQEPRQFNDPITNYPNPAGLFPERMSNGFRPVSYANPEPETGKTLEKGTAPRSALQVTNNGFGRQVSGNQLTDRTNANPQNMQRFYSAYKEVGLNAFGGNGMPAPLPFANNRVSGLDGAMDDLADLVMETSVEDRRSPVSRSVQSTAAPMSVNIEEQGASCFKPSGGKGKQRTTTSPTKPTASAPETTASSPANVPSSPKKSGEHSPAKAKLEQVTNKFRRGKKEDPRGMSSDEKVKRSEKWRKRFQYIKEVEQQEIKDYCGEEKRRSGGRR